MSHLWSFSPDAPRERSYDAYRPVVKSKPEVWIAPEHAKGALGMVRAFPKDDRGLPIPGAKKELKLDSRPNLLVPPRPTRRLFL